MTSKVFDLILGVLILLVAGAKHSKSMQAVVVFSFCIVVLNIYTLIMENQ